MLFGYARVSTKEQNLARQLVQLKEAGCQVIFEEKVTGANLHRQELQELLSVIKKGDEILVTDLTRISRSSKDLFELVELLKDKNVALRSLKDTWLDMSSNNPYSHFLLTVMAGVNQLERDLTRMRQKEGIELAKAKGLYNGRPKKYTPKHVGMKHALELYHNKENKYTVKEIVEITNVSRSAFIER
ncbi:recombinase family protein [Peribacillus asahii]|uniref:recombinase family protein n=1 Tax=Peribacillus asahii TaxID=228899 RepID=UPI0020798CBC|nr:recombinase family protein [Peribacillus asahii]USK72732.1 recombinase family protein [Peribacillus asahii]